MERKVRYHNAGSNGIGTSSWDLPTYFGMALALLMVAAISGYIPARRASGVNPMQVLRSN